MKLLLVDLDGTLREPLSANQFIQHPRDQKIIPLADRALSHFYALGYFCVGISNQGGVAAGHKTLEDCFCEQLYTLTLFPELSKIYFCPDFEGKQLGVVNREGFHRLLDVSGVDCASFRKPAPGMIQLCLLTHEVDRVLYVGDRLEDEQALKRLAWILWKPVIGEKPMGGKDGE